jgi:hypothetical protein
MNAKVIASLSILLMSPAVATPQSWRVRVTPDWSTVDRTLHATPTYQIVASALMRPTSPIHDRVYQNIHNLQANYARFQGWEPSPRIAVAELEPPANGKTHWDFSSMDPVVVDFLEATKGHPVVMNLATIPEWMYKTDKPVPVPSNPDQLDYEYEQGTELRDPTMKEVADYFKRLASWYVKGGFRDEFGTWHESGHHYKLDYWEVLNEVDFEHQTTPEDYTKIYDAVVEAVREVDPSIKFIGLAVAGTSSVPLQKQNPRYFQYFLNAKNHRPGIPIDGISYHFYAFWSPDSDNDVVFQQADRFLSEVRYVEAIREQLSPSTRSFIDEVGFISDDDAGQNDPNHVSAPLPDSYWNLAASFYAYLFNDLSQLPGIQAVGMSSGLGYPNHYFPSVTMMDWRTGQPNARYWSLKLLIDHMALNSKMVHTEVEINQKKSSTFPRFQAQAFVTPSGEREILLINQRDQPYDVVISGANGGEVSFVDQSTGFHPVGTEALESEWADPSDMTGRQSAESPRQDRFTLQGFGVAVVTLRQ